MEATEGSEAKRHIDVLNDFFTGWNKHDARRALDCCTNDTVWTVPSMPALKGKEAARTYLEAMFTSFPDMHFDYTIHTSVDGLKAAVGWHLTATLQERMDPPGFAATHKPVDLTGACLYEFEDGLISRHTIVYDALEFARQLKALPRSDRMAVVLQRLMVRLPGRK